MGVYMHAPTQIETTLVTKIIQYRDYFNLHTYVRIYNISCIMNLRVYRLVATCISGILKNTHEEKLDKGKSITLKEKLLMLCDFYTSACSKFIKCKCLQLQSSSSLASVDLRTLNLYCMKL